MNSASLSSHFRATISVAGTLALALAGLTSGVRAADTPSPAPAIANAATVPPAAIVDQPLPPAASQEIEEPQPSAQAVRLAGHWRWQEGHYAWIPTHWEVPPVANASWVEPRWEKSGNGYVLVEGYWQQSVGPAASTSPGVEIPATPAPATVTVIAEPPPPAPREIIVERPSPRHVWVDGYWGWRAGRHVWIGGHWDLPPRSHAVWVQPRWERRGNGYVLVEGYWTEGGSPVRGEIVVRESPGVVIIHGPPPPPPREVRGPRPSSRHTWIGGYWAAQGGRTVWIPGHWEIPPRGHTAWVAPRWERRNGGYIFIQGTWR